MALRQRYTIIDLGKFKYKKVVCLTLDLEQDYGDLLDRPSYEGLEHIPDLVNSLKKRNIPLTCFVQGSLLETHPTYIKQLSMLDVEFELHSYSHPKPKEKNTEFEIEKGKEIYESFFVKDPIGYRAPAGVINEKDYETLASHGFKFDSSIFPSIRPGTFNNLRKPTRPYFLNNSQIVEFPLTVFSYLIRVPISLSYIALLGKPYLYLLKTFNLPSLITFGFHLHDLFQLDSWNNIPIERFPFVYRGAFERIYRDSEDGLSILDGFITVLQKRGYKFSKLKDIYDALSKGTCIGTGKKNL